ncbi:PLP-dependent aminotransferase family protein [Chitinophaga qingshengii]|uniref:PLP-dependent aminotransferase family protein n=1 Tax=Chitinophaga qingshengii TaxID=1569794 RepID=A0ABR7TVT5_9BACT|nr:PLP-dependent aminotransferase family protein [Chitinophaga qingshengii]MBC9934113.1 PLP-dependent aminotransferase family protein [Chitinophaga qingshengii]
MNNKKDFLYQQLADKIEAMIGDGAYAIGDKLPSVRSLHREHGISVSTALQVYLQLERKGLVEAREKSGYYVSYSRQLLPKLPEISLPARTPAPVNISGRAALIRDAMGRKGIVSLIGAAPHPSLLPVAKLNKALRQAAREEKTAYIPYGDIDGHLPLRRHIAKLSLAWGGSVAVDDILITNGAIEAATICLRAVAKAGDTIAIESPTFVGLLQAIENLGMKALEIPTDPVTGISLEHLETALRKRKVAACLIISNYSNPLGCCIPDQHKKQLARLIEQYQVPLIEDDAYGDLHFNPERPRTIKSFDRADLVLYCSSVSKSIAAGLRIGWIISRRYHDRLAQLKFMSSASTGLLPQLVLTRFLDQQRMDLHLKPLRQALRTQQLQISRAIQQYFPADTRLTRPEGGLSLWVVLPPQADGWELHRKALLQHISFTPGSLFSSQGQYNHCLRLSNANPFDEDQAWAVQTLGKLIRQQLDNRR